MFPKIIDVICVTATVAITVFALVSSCNAQGGGDGGGGERSRVGVSVDRNGLHVRITVGNPQTIDTTITGGIFRLRQEQIISPINQQGFHGTNGLAHDGIGSGDSVGGPGYGTAR